MTGLIPLFAVAHGRPVGAGGPARVPRPRPRLPARPPGPGRRHPHRPATAEGAARCWPLVGLDRLPRMLERLGDEAEFLSPYGVRSLSAVYRGHPFEVWQDGHVTYTVDYEPAESTSALFGGNSNWRGPIWFPVNYLLIDALVRYHQHLGDDFTVEYPRGSGAQRTLGEIARRPGRPPGGHLPARRDRPAPGVRRHRALPDRPGTGATACSSTSTSTATTAPASEPPTRPAGPGSWPT